MKWVAKNDKFKIVIEPDYDPSNPRTDNDNLGIMVCFHRKYELGDKTGLASGDFSGWDAMKEHLETEEEAIAILPVYLMDHSGLTLRTTSFGDPWDSGQVGFIYTTKRQADKMGQAIRDLERQLKMEVFEYDQYLNGDVYGFTLYKRREVTLTDSADPSYRKIETRWEDTADSVSGFYGTDWKTNGLRNNLPYEAHALIDELREVNR